MEAVLTFHQGFDGHLFIDGKGKLLLSFFGIGKAIVLIAKHRKRISRSSRICTFPKDTKRAQTSRPATGNRRVRYVLSNCLRRNGMQINNRNITMQIPIIKRSLNRYLLLRHHYPTSTKAKTGYLMWRDLRTGYP